MKDLIRNISIINRYIQKFLDVNLQPYGIGSGQFSFLLAIYENELLTMQELTNILGLDKATVNKSLKKLVELNYVEIIIDENDRRVKRVITTAKANAIINDLYAIRNSCYQLLTQGDDSIDMIIEQMANKSSDYLCLSNDEEIKIAGLNKLSLLDYPHQLSCTVFTSGCNFKCPFCHNKDLVFVPENVNYYNLEDVYTFLKKRKGVVKAITISGGEPTLQSGLLPFIKTVKQMGYLIKLDTNGYHPDYLSEIINSECIDYIAMDIKNSPQKYAITCGMKVENFDLTNIERSIDLIKNSGVDYEFRTTIVDELHDLSDFEKIMEWIGPIKRYCLQYFENKGSVIDNNFTPPKEHKVQQIADLLATNKNCEVIIKGGNK